MGEREIKPTFAHYLERQGHSGFLQSAQDELPTNFVSRTTIQRGAKPGSNRLVRSGMNVALRCSAPKFVAFPSTPGQAWGSNRCARA